ncbi:MAG: branched-chain amino acid ABC transporter permease [Anaerolineae bacterium]|nr:branched-chain amino acid ABC transporter permease [Anaerolineae bacterium]
MSGYYAGVIILTCVNLLSVLGLSLLTGFTGSFCFGQAGFMAVGAYVSTILTMEYAAPFPIALLAGALASMLVSIPLGYPTLRLKGDYFAIATLGFAEAVRLVVENLEKITGGSRGIPSIPPHTNLPTILIVSIVAIWLVRNYIGSRHGRNCIAVREDELAAEAIAVDSFRYKQISFAINGFLGGLSGGFLAHYVGFIQPSMFGIPKSTELIVMVIFGGMHSVTGAVLAAIILTALPEVLRAASAWRLVAYGAVVVLIMVVRPEGLLGSWELSRDSLQELWGGLKTRLAKE